MIKIGSNIASFKAQRQLNEASTSLSKTFERLSSGLRINHAADDPAGLALSESLRASQRVFTQGVRNLNDGLSLLNIADSALEQLGNIVSRLKELAEQSANGTYGSKQRQVIDAEAQALSKEYLRITKSTTFNGRSLFSADFGKLSIQAGYGNDGSIQSGLGGAIGTGTYQTATTFAGENASSQTIALGDLNGDGILDMVTGGYNDGSVAALTVRLGLGNGNFSSSAAITTSGTVIDSVTLADLNGDGILDILSSGNSTINLQFGLGNGTFREVVSYDAGIYADSITTGDLNGDGMLDVIIGGSTGSGGFATVRLGQSNGKLGDYVTYTTEASASKAVSVADLNGDGILDLVTAGQVDGGFLSKDGYATVRLGRGDGTFGNATSYTTQAQTSLTMQLADLNGDGKIDMITGGTESAFGPGSIMIRQGNGDGTFGTAITFLTGVFATLDVKVGDIDGDGILDIVGSGSYTNDFVNYFGFATIHRGLGNGTFQTAVSYSTGAGAATAASLGDLNNDGVLDIAVVGNTEDGDDGAVSILRAVTSEGVSPLLAFKLTTSADSLQALSQFSTKINSIAEQRGKIGAFQSRITYAENTLQSTADNYATAYSRIRDADIATEAADLVRLQIKQQAASAVLAQANQQPALAIKLLKNLT